MPQADKTAATILTTIGIAITISGAGFKYGVVDPYNADHPKCSEYVEKYDTDKDKKIIYNGTPEYDEPTQPSAPPMDGSCAQPSAPSAPCLLGFVNDLGHQNEQSFNPYANSPNPFQNMPPQNSPLAGNYMPPEGWIYEDAYNIPFNPSAQPQSQPSVYAEAFEPIGNGSPQSSPQGMNPAPSAPPVCVAAEPSAPCLQPPAYDPGPQVFAEKTPNTLKFNSKVPKGNIVRPLPHFNAYSNFKLSDIKYVMFDDKNGNPVCYRLKHSKLNWFAGLNKDCLTSSFIDSRNREHTIRYWYR